MKEEGSAFAMDKWLLVPVLVILVFFLVLLMGFDFGPKGPEETSPRSEPSSLEPGQLLREMEISGSSMAPGLPGGSRVVVDFNYFVGREIARGDIVVYKLQSSDSLFVKRVIALPGDVVVFSKLGKIVVNGSVLEEPYLEPGPSFYLDRVAVAFKQLQHYDSTVPRNSFLLLGDNRASSVDSGSIGLVSGDHIVGKVVGKV